MEEEKDEVVEHLMKIGVSPKLIKMPTVLKLLKEKEVKLQDLIVDPKGNIIYTDKEGNEYKYEYLSDGTVMLKSGDFIQEHFMNVHKREISNYTEEIASQNRLEFFKNKAKEIEEKNKSYEERLILLKLFAQRCTKIPFMGKRISNILVNQSLRLDSYHDDQTISELDDYQKLVDEREKTKKYKAAYGSLRKCLVEDCGKVPFFGRKVLKNLEKFQKEIHEKEDNRDI